MNKNCQQCGVQFEVTDQDRSFLEEVSPVFSGQKYLIPEPEICYECSLQNRLIFKNEKYLYHRKSDYSGKQIISIYSPDKPYKVWELKAWQSDELNAEQYGFDFDFNKDFFEQLDQLVHAVPHRHVLHFFDPVNSDFSNDVDYGKNQYMCFLVAGLEDCMYTHDTLNSKNLVDCFHAFYSELGYELNMSQHIYNSKYVYKSEKVKDSAFIFNSKNLENCFFCFNLHDKSYCIFNQQYSKDDYYKELAKYDLGSYQVIEDLKKKFFAEWSKYPVMNLDNKRIENSTGDLNESLKDCINCHNTYGEMEKCKDTINAWVCYNTWRAYAGSVKNSYEFISGTGSNLFFSFEMINCDDSFYSLMCRSSKNLFGCVGLKNKQYCIFNKQYSQEEYEKVVPQIIEQMKKKGQWGMLMPMWISPFAYNETRSNQWFPLSKEEALAMGAKWSEEEITNFYQGTPEVLPDHIKDSSDELTKKILKCENCGRNYKIIQQELNFYRQQNIPLPHKCFHCRYENRLNFKPPAKLWACDCAKCGKEMLTSYAPDRPEKVYCEECYLKELY